MPRKLKVNFDTIKMKHQEFHAQFKEDNSCEYCDELKEENARLRRDIIELKIPMPIFWIA